MLPFIDRPYLTVDLTTAKDRGRIYLHGNATAQTVDGVKRLSGGRHATCRLELHKYELRHADRVAVTRRQSD